MANDVKEKVPFAQTILNIANAYGNAVAKFSVDLLTESTAGRVKKFIEVIKLGPGGIEESQWLSMISVYVNAGVIKESDASKYMKMKDLAHPFDWIMYFVIAIKLFTNYITVHSEAGLAIQSQAINKERRPYLPSYSDVINAAFIAPEKTGQVREVMKRSGLKDDDIDLLFLSRYALYPVEQVRTLYLRGIINAETMRIRMRELGFTDTRIDEQVKSWEIIPGPQDLFWMVGKEAFEPDAIKMLGLGAEFPAEQVSWLEKQGVSRDWALRYWYAHWDQPSIQQGFEMLHRGVIGWPELDMLFKTVEIPPFWRDKLTKIAYQPYTRVDVRRMHQLGVLTDEELIRSYQDLGYDKDHAVKMAQFTVLYNNDTGSRLTKSQIISSYKDGLLKRSDAKELLVGINVGEDEAEFLLYHEDFKKDKEKTDKIIKNIGDKYSLNLIDELEVRKQLGMLNLLADRVEILLETWNIDKLQDTKLPSKTDLDKMFRAGIITEDIYYSEMIKLGYTVRATNWFIALSKKNTGG